MNMEKFGIYTVYWENASILGPARLSFSSSSFSLDHCKDDYSALSQMKADLLAATDFFLSKKIELFLTTNPDKV